MLSLIKYIHLFSIVIFLGCAAIGPPTGGKIDKEGPKLLSIYPLQNTKLPKDKKIILEFNELINPISVPNSIRFNSNIKYKLKIRGRTIVLQPDKFWPNNDLIRISISRKIRDYQDNKMSKPINIIFSTGGTIPKGKISGTLVGSNNNLIEIGLYPWPITDTSSYIQKVEVDNSGFFQFNGVNLGDYTIAGVEGVLKNINNQIRKKYYILPTSSYFSFKDTGLYNLDKILLSKPIKRKNIISIEMLSQYSFNLLMNDDTKDFFMIDSTYIPGDTISIIQEKSNHIETYLLPKYSFVLPEIQDTLSPQLISAKFIEGKFKMIFSEPVNISYNAISTKKDSLDLVVNFNFESDNIIVLPKLNKEITNIQLLGGLISDWNKNYFIDSVKTIQIKYPELNRERIIGGNIFGSIDYDGLESIIIEARNLSNNDVFFTESYNNKFKFENLPADLYVLWGYEKLNILNQNIYFSGTWSPYKRASKFSSISDTIDVRSRWDIEGVIIEIP